MAYNNENSCYAGGLGPSMKQLEQSRWETNQNQLAPPPTQPSCVAMADQLHDITGGLHLIITELTGRLYPLLSKGNGSPAVEAVSPDPSSDLFASLMESRDKVGHAITRIRDLINEVRL